MRKGEKGILLAILASVVILASYKGYQSAKFTEPDPGIPFYSTASPELTTSAAKLLHKFNCQECHSLWAVRDMTVSVPAPALDGMGDIRDEAWLFDYFSAENPQEILPSRLKPQYRMPSYAKEPEADRRILAQYIASLRVKDWYLEETKKRRYEKLTGKDYVPNDSEPK